MSTTTHYDKYIGETPRGSLCRSLRLDRCLRNTMLRWGSTWKMKARALITLAVSEFRTFLPAPIYHPLSLDLNQQHRFSWNESSTHWRSVNRVCAGKPQARRTLQSAEPADNDALPLIGTSHDLCLPEASVTWSLASPPAVWHIYYYFLNSTSSVTWSISLEDLQSTL